MPGWTEPPPPASRLATSRPADGVERLEIQWDAGHGVVFVSHPQGLTLETNDDVQRWRDEVYAKFEELEREVGGPFPVVVCVDGLNIRPSVAAEYGRVVREYADRFVSGLARYSRRPNGVGQIITVAAMKEGFRANLFMSRAEAIAHALAQANGSESPKSPRSPV
jgi:hypothetical protein